MENDLKSDETVNDSSDLELDVNIKEDELKNKEKEISNSKDEVAMARN